MQTLNIRIWDIENDAWNFVLIVPLNVTKTEIINILQKEHQYLCTNDEKDIYEIQERTPDILLDYVCKKYGWSWHDFSCDIEIALN